MTSDGSSAVMSALFMSRSGKTSSLLAGLGGCPCSRRRFSKAEQDRPIASGPLVTPGYLIRPLALDLVDCDIGIQIKLVIKEKQTAEKSEDAIDDFHYREMPLTVVNGHVCLHTSHHCLDHQASSMTCMTKKELRSRRISIQ
jgi:hypothetical protein